MSWRLVGLTLFWSWAVIFDSYLFWMMWRAWRLSARLAEVEEEWDALQAHFKEQMQDWIFYDGSGS